MNKIKKFLSVLTSVTCIGSVCTASVNACPFYDIHDNDLCYEIIDENNDGTDDYLVLANCDKHIESVVIPSSVKSIGSGAFCCENLKDIVIPKSVEFIGAYAFDGTKWIKDKIAENPVVVVNDMLIYGGSCKGNVEIPDNVKYIGAGAFMGNEDIEQVTVSENVEEIHQEAFSYCTELKEIIIENPDCDIIDYDRYDVATITNSYDENFSGTIYGYGNSKVHAYAQKHNISFVSFNEMLSDFLLKSDKSDKFNYSMLDMNKDGKYNVFDYILIKRKIL